MKVELWQIGKTNEAYLREGIAQYEKRLGHYLPFQIYTFSELKKMGKLPKAQLKMKEGEMVLKQLKKDDFLVLLDERGKAFTSAAFAEFIEHKMALSHKRLIFLIGGAFGFPETLYNRANATLSLSKMTFSHQMIRLFFVEQLYRAMTILKNEPYHNG